MLFVTDTALAPELLKDAAPVNTLPALLSVIAAAPAVKLEVPLTLIAPDCVIAPLVVTVKLPPACEIPVIATPPASVRDTLPLVVLVALKLVIVLVLFNVIPVTALTVNKLALMMPAPVSCTEPVALDKVTFAAPALAAKLPAVIAKLPPAVKVIVPVVVMLLATVITFVPVLLLAVKLSNGFVAPIVPKLIVPVPACNDKLRAVTVSLSIEPKVSALAVKVTPDALLIVVVPYVCAPVVTTVVLSILVELPV